MLTAQDRDEIADLIAILFAELETSVNEKFDKLDKKLKTLKN